jgi:hypothetical protein
MGADRIVLCRPDDLVEVIQVDIARHESEGIDQAGETLLCVRLYMFYQPVPVGFGGSGLITDLFLYET